MKVYHGIDIVQIPRFEEVARRNPGLVRDVFTERERAYCESLKDPFPHLAVRFAAKESYAKALGTGFQVAGIDHLFKEIEVIRTPAGRPGVAVTGWAAKLA